MGESILGVFQFLGGSDLVARKKLLIVTTVPETICTILKGQPKYLNDVYDVSLVASPGGEVERVFNYEGVPVYSVPMFRGISPFRDLISIIRMIFLIIRLRPDIVHSYTPKAGLVAMLAARICFVSVRIHTFTGLIFPTQMGVKQRLLILIDRLICLCATKVVPEGEGVKRDLVNFKITQKSLDVIGRGNIAGVDVDYFSPGNAGVRLKYRSMYSIPDDGFVFCFVGRLNVDKGVAELAAAFFKLPDTAYLILVGGLDVSAPLDNSVLEQLAGHPRVRVLGFLDDIRPPLHASNILVLPSYREGFPNVVLQAGAMQLPVIATDINGCNEVVETGFNGWLVPVKNVRVLQGVMLSTMGISEALLDRMGQRARQRVIDDFERNDHWQRMRTFYAKELSR